MITWIESQLTFCIGLVKKYCTYLTTKNTACPLYIFTLSVTRWLDLWYLAIYIQEWKFAQLQKQKKNVQTFYQPTKWTLKRGQILLNFAKAAKFCQIWSHCFHHLHHSWIHFKSNKLKRFRDTKNCFEICPELIAGDLPRPPRLCRTAQLDVKDCWIRSFGRHGPGHEQRGRDDGRCDLRGCFETSPGEPSI